VPTEDDAAVPISARNPTWGSRTAPVTVVEFADFQCPYSARVEKTLQALRSKYGAENLRLVWKNNPLPFHLWARPAAAAATGVFELGGRDAFWRFHDTLFVSQADLSNEAGPALDKQLEQWAADAGVTDLAALRAGMGSNRWNDPVDADLRDGINSGVRGTPSFFVNGVFINGAQPVETFVQTIDEELTKARAKLDAGTPRERVYAEMARENRAAHPMPPPSENELPDTGVYKIPVGTSPVRGNATALVTIVEFGDFQCPFTGRVQPTLKALRDEYGDKIRIVWKNNPLPFHPAGEAAAQAALQARANKGDAAFWDAYDRLFASQKDLMNGTAPDLDRIAAIVSKSGIDADRIKKAMAGHAFKSVIDADKDLAEDFRAIGTPSFFIDGRRLVGAQPQKKFEEIIDEEITKAQAVVAQGTPPAGVYAALTKNGKGPPEPETKAVPSLSSKDPARGNLQANVVIHEWGDFQSPDGAHVQAVLTQLLRDYGTRIKLVWHDLPLPLHPDAPLAAQAARETYRQRGADAFWAMHDKLFSNRSLERAGLDRYAQDLNLKLDEWASALDGATHAAEIEADQKAAGDVGIKEAPAFLIAPAGARTGYFLSGAQTYGKFRRLIDRALAGKPPH
jgi:protein-disulfide isomerase